MSLAIPSAVHHSPAASRPMLEAVEKKLGSVPNLFRLLGTSPAALEGYLALSGALAKGGIDGRTGERVAIAVAVANGCDYCVSAHTFLGKNVAKLDAAELEANRHGRSLDAHADAAVRFVTQVALTRGHVTPGDLEAVKAAGYSDAQIVELVVHVALNTLTNALNSVARTPIDFPVVGARAA